MEPAHPLAIWLRMKSLTFEAAARLFGVANGSVVYRYAYRGRIPRPDVMARIMAATAGQIGPAHFYHSIARVQSEDAASSRVGGQQTSESEAAA
jgi:hypothetical protein